MSYSRSKTVVEIKIEQITTNLESYDGTAHDDKGIDPTYEEQIEFSSDSSDKRFEIHQTSRTSIQRDSKYRF